MPTALIFGVPAYGHVNPSLPLVAELVKRGHRVVYVLSEAFRDTVESLGAEFQPYSAVVPNDYFNVKRLDGNRPMQVSAALMKTTEEVLPEALALARHVQPDYIMYDAACPWGQYAARILNLPAVVSMSLMPLISPPITTLLNVDMISIIVYITLVDLAKGMETHRRLKAVAKQYNVPPLQLFNVLNAQGDLVISYTSTYYQPFLETVASNTRFIGRILSDVPIDPTFSFERVGSRRLIYVSLGTINNADLSFFKACIEAFAGTDDFVMISTGKGIDPDLFGSLPDNLAVYRWVPQLDVLRRAALFVTHGGLGGIHDGLYFGVPLLLIPQQNEQFYNANRVVELGAGLMLKKRQVTAASIRTTAAKLLADPSFKAAATRVGDSFRAAGGAAKGVDEIEALLRQRSAL